MIGIYAIKNLVNNKVYIGSSINIEKRWKKHKTELKSKVHSNPYLIKAYHKYGKENFEFIILEICKEKELVKKELQFIIKYNSLDYKFGYNLKLPIKHPSITCSKKYSKILSEGKKGVTPTNFKNMQKTRWKGVEVYINNVFYKKYSSYNEAERDLNINKGYIYSYFKFKSLKRKKYKEYEFKKI